MKTIKGGKRLRSNTKKNTSIPALSIITIVYNEREHLEGTIKSVLDQANNSSIEYIVIDGGSTDGTIEIIKKYEDHIDYWVSEPDKGISDAFNKGILASTGRLIGMVNANDWYEPDAFDSALENFFDNDIIYGDVQFWDGGIKKNRTNSNHNKLRMGMTVAHPAVFMKREMYEKFGLFEVKYKVAMDYAFIIRLYFNKAKFKKIDKVLVNMRTGGLSDTNWLEGVKEEKSIKDIYFNKWANLYYYIKQILHFNYKKIKNK